MKELYQPGCIEVPWTNDVHKNKKKQMNRGCKDLLKQISHILTYARNWLIIITKNKNEKHYSYQSFQNK